MTFQIICISCSLFSLLHSRFWCRHATFLPTWSIKNKIQQSLAEYKFSQNTDWETYCFNSWEFYLHLHSYSSLAKTWLSIRNRISPGVIPYLGSECSLFSSWIVWLRTKEPRFRGPYLKWSNAVLYVQQHISARLLAAVREMSPRSFSSWGGSRERRK